MLLRSGFLHLLEHYTWIFMAYLNIVQVLSPSYDLKHGDQEENIPCIQYFLSAPQPSSRLLCHIIQKYRWMVFAIQIRSDMGAKIKNI